jgi:hypothetical protein
VANPHFAAKSHMYQFPKDVENVFLNARSLADIVDLDDELLIRMMSYDLANNQIFGNVKVVGMGWKAFELRDLYKAPIPARMISENQSSPSAIETGAADEQLRPSNGTNGHASTEFGSMYRPAPTPSKSPAAPSTTPAANMPPSTLGKRPRDDDYDNTYQPASVASETAQTTDPPYRDSGLANCGSFPPIFTNDGYVYRRHMRRVGWEVLRNWEIWALDTQEI